MINILYQLGKKNYLFLYLIVAYLISPLFIFSQVQTNILCKGDSTQLNLSGNHYGNIQWQLSTDTINWKNISTATDSSLIVTADSSVYYRAMVSEGVNCPTYYSDVVRINAGLWNANLLLMNVDSQQYGTNVFYSSSKLLVSWQAPLVNVDHYVITASESVMGYSEDFNVDPNGQNMIDTLKNLKSATPYSITIKGCLNSTCTSYIQCKDNVASATTDEEYWQIYGQPGTNTYDKAYKLHPNANVLSYAFPYGSWADPNLVGKIRYYGTPQPSLNTSGSIPAISYSEAYSDSMPTVAQFDLDSLNGLSYSQYSKGNDMFPYIGQSVAIPYNGKIRLFFNATLDDGQRRVFYIDSQDGYIGKDFDASSDSLCISAGDFTSGGNCEYTMALGTKFDSAFAQNLNMEHVMQFKIGYPMLDNEWIWNGDSAFLVSAIGLPLYPNNPCAPNFNKCAYASWDGNNWTYEYDGVCPKLFEGMRCPSIVHMGGDKYKIYFEYNQTLQTAPSDTLKPMKVMYSYGKRFPSFDDWEGISKARNVNYLWPDGTLLTDAEKSILDDYTFFAPIPNNQDFQIQYSNMNVTNQPSYAGTTHLLNH